ncbi:hypothetical protein N665_0451s0020 [Sinapis alba]|nr:hypothetical protein N665_0451s0020 [Sinapis alba]
MTGESCSLGIKETPLSLCDMTIVPSKRGLSSILSVFLLKSGEDSGKTVAREGSGVKFSKRLCLVVDDLVKESTRTNSDGSFSDVDKISFGGSLVVDAENLNESQGETNAVDIGVQQGEKDGVAVVELSQRECDTTVFSSSKSESDDSLAMVATQGTGLSIEPFNMSSGVDRIVNHDMEADDELRSCPCSFCLKAAYIWSDLNYQDIKARLSVLKKSQKEASILIQRNSKGKPTDVEFDVMGQWTSLFLNMDGILACENRRLQDSSVAMKDLREICKIDLERATKTPQLNNT